MDWLRQHLTKVPVMEMLDDTISALPIEGDDPKSLGDDPTKPPPGERKEPRGKS